MPTALPSLDTDKSAPVFLRSPNRKPRYRTARRQAMKDAGVLPCRRQWVWGVQPQALLTMPAWALESAVRGLGRQAGDSFAGMVWLWPVDARRLIRQDRDAGGRALTTRVELRHCPLCARPLMGHEAAVRRLLNESGPDGRRTACGGDCARDAQTRVWKKLNPAFRG